MRFIKLIVCPQVWISISSQCHLLVAFENDWLEALIPIPNHSALWLLQRKFGLSPFWEEEEEEELRKLKESYTKEKARQKKSQKRKEAKLFFFAFLSSHLVAWESFQHHPFGQQNPIQPRPKLYALLYISIVNHQSIWEIWNLNPNGIGKKEDFFNLLQST